MDGTRELMAEFSNKKVQLTLNTAQVHLYQKYAEEMYKKDLHHPDNHDNVVIRARHPGMRSQVDLRRHHYEQS